MNIENWNVGTMEYWNNDEDSRNPWLIVVSPVNPGSGPGQAPVSSVVF